MAEFECGFERKFSELGILQKEMYLEYKAAMRADGIQISIQKRDENGMTCKQQILSGISAEQAKQLVTFLYENAIPLETWEEILQEAYQCVKTAGQKCDD